jgi:hypothetical protein
LVASRDFGVKDFGVRGGPLFQAGRLGFLFGGVKSDEVGSWIGLIDAVLVLRYNELADMVSSRVPTMIPVGLVE